MTEHSPPGWKMYSLKNQKLKTKTCDDAAENGIKFLGFILHVYNIPHVAYSRLTVSDLFTFCCFQLKFHCSVT